MAKIDRHRELATFDDGLREAYGGMIVGVDEVGRGCLAGPICAGAVILPADAVLPYLDDSKKLSEARRESLYEQIIHQALAYNVAWCWAREIDKIGINPANEKVMREAVAATVAMCLEPVVLCIADQSPKPPFEPCHMMAKADSTSLCVAAASVVAKVERDRYMTHLGTIHPAFGFEGHKGYGSSVHLEALRAYGRLNGIHRFSFSVKGL
jgi:ribonuclease HII